MLKKCSSCSKEKHGRSFKNTSKTPDGKYPYCKECEYKLRVWTWHHRHNVAHRLYREIVGLLQFQASGKTHIYFNKDMFSKWLYMHPDFERLYGQYVNNLETLEFHVEIISRVGSVTFDNLRIILNNNLIEPDKLYDPQPSDNL